jgi:hypothetical protein
MEVTVNIDENILAQLKNHSDRDLNSIVTEALSNWTNQNTVKCPIDTKYCNSKEPCNNCPKAKNILKY